MVIRSIRLSYDHIWLYTRTVPYCYSSLKHQVASARHLLFVTILSFCRYLCYFETPFSWEINSCKNCPITLTLIDLTPLLIITLITRKDKIAPSGDTPLGHSWHKCNPKFGSKIWCQSLELLSHPKTSTMRSKSILNASSFCVGHFHLSSAGVEIQFKQDWIMHKKSMLNASKFESNWCVGHFHLPSPLQGGLRRHYNCQPVLPDTLYF